MSTARHYAKVLSALAAAALMGVVSVTVQATPDDLKKYLRPEVKVPADNKITPERVKLGKMLFFEPRLSGSNWISCATCHNPALGWSDGLPTAIGHNMKVLGRATPTILNSAYYRRLMWDGRMRSLEDQATGPIQADVEMNQDMDLLIQELKAIPGYVEMFEKAYPGEGITEETVAKAIATFERTIVATESPFDRWIKGDEDAMSTAAKRGFKVFEGKANCDACHQNHNFSDNGFHNIGVPNSDDPGRYKLIKVKVLKGAFKTPTLRDIELTPPYMHNGAYDTLAEVVEHYNKGGVEKDNLDPNMKPLHLTEREKDDLVEFLKALTGEGRDITVPKLPN